MSPFQNAQRRHEELAKRFDSLESLSLEQTNLLKSILQTSQSQHEHQLSSARDQHKRQLISARDKHAELSEQLDKLKVHGRDIADASQQQYEELKKMVQENNSALAKTLEFSLKLHETMNELAAQQKLFADALNCQQTELEHINELVRRNIRDTNKGFWDINLDRRTKFGGTHAVYDDEFYKNNQYGSVTSGIHVLRRFIKPLNIQSVVDFGCGTGTWLYASRTLGAKTVLGFDGDYVNRDFLLIDNSEFKPHDLEQPINTDQKFDLAISVEVAEHLRESSASTFIHSICNASDLVLFSAAHVGQGGDNHINEQPLSYWQKKFKRNGYRHIEIRDLYQGDWEIESWYRENIGLYVKAERHSEVCEKIIQSV